MEYELRSHRKHIRKPRTSGKLSGRGEIEMTREEVIRYGLDLCKQELGVDGSIFIPKLISTAYLNAKIDSESRTCNNCKSKSCSVKRILLEREEMNPDYFSCNDWEQN